MVIRDGWLRIRHWLIPWGEPTAQRISRQSGGARPATRQAFVTAQPLDWFDSTSEQPRDQPSTDSLTTRPYLLGRYGFDSLEQIILLDQAGSEEQLMRIINWVEKAHRRLKMFVLYERKLESTIQALQDAHQPAVEKLADILIDGNGENEAVWLARRRQQSMAEIWGNFQKKIPGLVFPKAQSKHELEEWIATARNANAWLAQHGTFGCRCRALPDYQL